MIYLLDTDTLIFMIRGLKPRRRKTVAHRRAQRVVDECRARDRNGHIVGLSSITVSELEYGARLSEDYEREKRAVRKVLVPFTAFPYDAVSCPVHYGRIRHALEVAGQPIGALDMFIAAHALALDAVLITNNTDHFGRIDGLQIENWSQ